MNNPVEHEYRGFIIYKGYSVLGNWAWLVNVDTGTIEVATLKEGKEIIDFIWSHDVFD